MKKTATTKIVNTNNVKVQFMTSSREFTSTMAKYYVAINEMADHALTLKKNIKVCQEWKEIVKNDPKKVEESESQIAHYEAEAKLVKKELQSRIDECYKFLGNLYKSYVEGADSFEEGIREWFKGLKITPTDTLVNFMSVSIGFKTTTNTRKYKTGDMIRPETEKAFNKKFMSTLAQLMKDKNALKTDLYAYKFSPIKKK